MITDSHRPRNIHDILTKLTHTREIKRGEYVADCPAPGHATPNGHLTITDVGDKALAKCFNKHGYTEITAALGYDSLTYSNDGETPQKKLVATFSYEIEKGREAYAIERWQSGKDKDFKVKHKENSKYVYGMGDHSAILYRLPEVKEWIASGKTIRIPEGELKADCLISLDLPATSSPFGAGRNKWRPEYSQTLAGADVIILPDNDRPGREFAEIKAKSLYGTAKSVKVLELPGLGEKGDVIDWLGMGHTKDELLELEANTPLYHPEPKKSGMLPLAVWRERVAADPPVADIIQDILPNASTEYMLICGRAGIGKTNLVLDLAFRIATGTPWFSHKTKKCHIGYLGFEGTQRKLLERFEKLEKSFPDHNGYLFVDRELPFKLAGQGIDKFLTLIDGLDMVIIDPIRYIVPGDYTKPEHASAFITTLKEACAKTGTIPILIHHVRKPDRRLTVRPEDLAFEVKGATDYVDAAATVLLFERARQAREKDGRFGSNPDDRVLHFCKVKDAPADPLPLPLRFNREKLLYEPIALDSLESIDEDQ